MNLLKRIFRTKPSAAEPTIKFGRFSDSYKEEERYLEWDKSLAAFEKGDYLEAFELFLKYLQNDQDNLTYTRENDIIEFQLYQGSKKITGRADQEKIAAEANVAIAEVTNIGFLRKLIELNFHLKYSRYALDDQDTITLTFTSYMLDASPYKLYYALKELSVNADKQDDILLDEFDSLKSINTGHLQVISEEEKEIKAAYLHEELDKVIDIVENGKLDFQKYPGGKSYLILATVYKLDYLLRPEGSTMEIFEKLHKTFFTKNGKSEQRRNHDLLKKLKIIVKRDPETFHKELYEVKSTFGITAPTSHDRLKELIDDEIHNMDWYIQNNHQEVAISIPTYIVGYALFNHAVPLPDKELFTLFYKILNQRFFNDLGFSLDLKTENKLNKAKIVASIREIEKKMNAEYPKFSPNTSQLVFTSITRFAKSYLLMMRDLDVTKIKAPR